MILIALFLYALVCVFLIKRYNLKNGGVRTITAIIFSFLWYYCIVPLVFIYKADQGAAKYGYVRHFINASPDRYMMALLAMTIFLIALIATYESKRKTYLKKCAFVNTEKIYLYSRRLAYITFIIGGVCFLYYIAAFGGVARMLAYSEYMRSFATSGTNVLTYLQTIMYIPSRLVTVSPFLFVISGVFDRSKLYVKLLFLISFILGFLFLLYDAGKMGIFIYLLSCVVPVMMRFTRRAWTITLLVGIFCAPLIGIADAIFHYISMNEWELEESSTILAQLSQFTFPFSNICNLDGILNVSGIRWCQDFVTGFCNLIPGVNFPVSYEPTSMFYSGQYWQEAGGTPNDTITFGFIEMWLLGVVIMGYLWGVISARIDVAISRTPDKMPYWALRCSFILLFFVLFVNADIVGIARNQFTFTILLGLTLYCCKK